MNRAALRQSISTGTTLHPDAIIDRHRLRVGDGERISSGTYFNGFAASYWRRWTVVEEVTLDITVSGPGATVTVYRSMANGRSQRVDSATTTETRAPTTSSSTSRWCRSSTAAGTGSTSSPATTTS